MQMDSCHQCKRRRIECDAAVPQCAKCRKKGLACSGPGKQYRFVENHRASRGSRKQSQRNLLHSSTKEAQAFTISSNTVNHTNLASDGYQQADIPTSSQPTRVEAEEDLFNPSSSPLPVVLFDESQVQVHVADYGTLGSRQLYALESLNPQVRMLFDYFSEKIAPAMVVVDHRSNGYRNILLPLASQDPVVQRAVSVVAALHLGAKQSHLLRAAEEGRTVIIQRLRRDASCGRYDKVFSLSTWATVILLLVGETVTGGHEFVYLFSMLQTILGSSEHLINLYPDAGRFLEQQSGMFNLFAPPFLSPSHGFSALEGQLDDRLGWIASPETETDVANAPLRVLAEAIYLARDLYLQESQGILSPCDRELKVEEMIRLVDQVDESTQGMHAFVWCYFIAGAASSNIHHRQFFLKRLRQAYDRIGMRNILSTISILEELVWPLPKDQSWTHCPAILNRTLIM